MATFDQFLDSLDPDEKKYVGEFREGIPWNLFSYDENGIIMDNYVNGERVPVERVEEQATVVEEVVEE